MRVVTGTISHESSTFTPVPTTWRSYREERFGYLRGDEVFEKFRGTNSAPGGFLAGAEEFGFELLPTIFANAHPSAPTPREIFDEILGDLLSCLADIGQVDGVLLDLHGAMVAEGISDGEGHILAAVREQVGAEVPIIAQLDIHSNISRQMVAIADVLIGHETYPEIDQAERGRECAQVMSRILQEGLKPTLALHQLPLIWGLNQVTAHPPMREAIAELHRIEAQPGVVCGSIATCFPLADIPDLGASVYIATDDNLDLAQQYADELAAWIWERREQWQGSQPTAAAALEQAEKKGSFPVMLADRNDNTGGGSPGDSTGVLRTFIAAGLQDACVLYLVDPEAAALCHEAGAGATLSLQVGGKSTPLQGEPVAMNAEVVAVTDGRFTFLGPRYAGLDGDLGLCAHIRQDGVHIIITSERQQPFDIALCLTLDLDPRRMRYLGIKSSAHFRAGFEEFAGAIQVVSEPSVHSAEEVNHRFHHVGRKLYPFDDI